MKQKLVNALKMIIPEFAAAGAVYVMMFFSALPQLELFFGQDYFWIAVNCLIILAIIQLFYCLIGKLWISMLTVSTAAFIWSIADYYTTLYHGGPLFFSEYANAGTAFDVIGAYSFAIDGDVIKILAVFAVILGIVFLTFRVERNNQILAAGRPIRRRLISLACGAVAMGFVAFVTLGPFDIKPESTMGWSWKPGVEQYGLLVCGIEDLDSMLYDTYKVPEGYSAEALQDVGYSKPGTSEEYPNIIVILNETFFDLEKIYEVHPDINVLEDFYNIENAQFGYAVVGGGTNNAEFAMLTSNSVYMLNVSVPFNYIDFNECTENIVHYMEKLNYTTTGMHCGSKENYRRNSTYPQLGFDNIYLGKDAFRYYNKNGKRGWLDSDNYKDMLERLNEAGPGPQFMFLLTYQNHGGYDQNDADLDTVHVSDNYDDTMTGYLNEYLSSLKLSVDAFVELTQTLKDAGPTIVVMAGDHEPAFACDLQRNASSEAEFAEMGCAMVPYVIWTNYKEVPEEYGGLASMEDLVPMAAELAGLPVSAYYGKLLEMRESVPVRSSNGRWIDSDGKIGGYSTDPEHYELLNEYYRMEYNALLGGKDYREELFMP